jgi:trehalose 6-phosphate phosphatase
MASASELVTLLRREPRSTAVLTDFDGTLAPIVTDHRAATPDPRSLAALRRLLPAYARVGVASGRPVAYLRSHVGDELWLSGLYGLETWHKGKLTEAPQGEHWRPVVEAAAIRAALMFGGLAEDKGLSLTIHFRSEPARAVEVMAWARDEQLRSGLVVRPAKASVELHPPIHVDKGTSIEKAVAGLHAVCFIGDDVGDLAAFDALDRLAKERYAAVRVAVRTEESPPELLERADLVVNDADGVATFLEALAIDVGAATRRTSRARPAGRHDPTSPTAR